MDIQLAGKRALVGGASRGIGRAIAVELARAGASVVALARDDEALAALVAELPKDEGQTHQYLAIDVADGAALSMGIATLVTATPIQILVNNSGGPPAGPACTA
jgi:3-oxoacyl-[acyl-carrier protein] reductase